MTVNVQFRFRSGLPSMAFDNVRLRGSWDEQGRASNDWASHPMQRSRDEDGYDVFVARVPFPDGEIGTHFRWGNRTRSARHFRPVGDRRRTGRRDLDASRALLRSPAGDSAADLYLTWIGRLGANRVEWRDGVDCIRFSVWAPNTRDVLLVLADPAVGYVADDGTIALATIGMRRTVDGFWSVETGDDDGISDFDSVACKAVRSSATRSGWCYRRGVLGKAAEESEPRKEC
ncbi:hypothetical protein [Rhizobium leguminosarum]|uniref:hypothetical protein n=1 Tax=Rhizobium leguminosarum TaxID=384 RepID=UPI003F9A7FF7